MILIEWPKLLRSFCTAKQSLRHWFKANLRNLRTNCLIKNPKVFQCRNYNWIDSSFYDLCKCLQIFYRNSLLIEWLSLKLNNRIFTGFVISCSFDFFRGNKTVETKLRFCSNAPSYLHVQFVCSSISQWWTMLLFGMKLRIFKMSCAQFLTKCKERAFYMKTKGWQKHRQSVA